MKPGGAYNPVTATGIERNESGPAMTDSLMAGDPLPGLIYPSPYVVSVR